MKHAPLVKSAKARHHFSIGKHTAVLYGDIESAGMIQYLFVMALFEPESQLPCYFVASEVNGMHKELGGGSHFLGVFDGTGHANMGASNDWADEAKFTAEALRIINGRIGA